MCPGFTVRYHQLMSVRSFSLVLLMSLLFQANAQASTIVALTTARGVVVASDSLFVVIGGTGTAAGCKVFIQGDLYFATAGLFASRIAGFYAPDIMRKAARESATGRLSDIMTRFNVDTANALLQTRNAVEEWLKINANFNMAETMLIRNEGGVVRVLFSQSNISRSLQLLTTDGGGNMSFDRQLRSIVAGGSEPEMLAIGMRDHILRYQAQHADWITMDPIAAARMFVQMEVAAHPAVVGPPVAILQIQKDGSHAWIEKGACGS